MCLGFTAAEGWFFFPKNFSLFDSPSLRDLLCIKVTLTSPLPQVWWESTDSLSGKDLCTQRRRRWPSCPWSCKATSVPDIPHICGSLGMLRTQMCACAPWLKAFPGELSEYRIKFRILPMAQEPLLAQVSRHDLLPLFHHPALWELFMFFSICRWLCGLKVVLHPLIFASIQVVPVTSLVKWSWVVTMNVLCSLLCVPTRSPHLSSHVLLQFIVFPAPLPHSSHLPPLLCSLSDCVGTCHWKCT